MFKISIIKLMGSSKVDRKKPLKKKNCLRKNTNGKEGKNQHTEFSQIDYTNLEISQ